jgi:DNA topoisomerase VI subunit B
VDSAGVDFIVIRARMAMAYAQYYRMDPVQVAVAFGGGCKAPEEQSLFRGAYQ